MKISSLKIFSEKEREELEIKREKNLEPEKKKINLCVSSTFTSEPIEDYIRWWGDQFNLKINVQFAPYNQVFQELVNSESLLSKNKDVNLIMVRFEDWIREDTKSSDEQKILNLERNYRDLIEILKNTPKKTDYFVGVFPVSTHLNLSDIIKEKITQMYEEFSNEIKVIDKLIAVDFRTLARFYRIENEFDPYKDKEGHMPFSDAYIASMGSYISRKILSKYKQQFKVIVLDCDNTLWSGICGEDGANVEVSESFYELQKFMLNRYNEGMLLALCSKNNEKDVMDVFENNKKMILKKEHFVSWRINWENKSNNINEIAEELNLGIDSFIFIDDSKSECMEVAANAPKILTIELPDPSVDYSIFLNQIWAFDRYKITDEDKKRSGQYQSEKKRQEASKSSVNLNDYLKNLELKVSMSLLACDDISRVSQMTQKTNQFNLSTIRRTEDEIVEKMQDQNIKCWTVNVRDRFGDYGLVGFVITDEGGKELFIETLLLSCRVLGRNVENSIISGLKRYCNDVKKEVITLKYYPTEKNAPIHDFIKKVFEKKEETKEYIEYKIDIEKIKDTPEYIDFYYQKAFNKQNSAIDIINENENFYLDHIAIAVNNIKDSQKYYSAIGYQCTDEIYDPNQNVNLSICHNINYDSIELVSPYNELSPCNNILKRSNDIPYHLCFKVRNISDFIKMLSNNKIEYEIVSDAKKAILFDNKEVAFINIKQVALIELLEDSEYFSVNIINNEYKLNILRQVVLDIAKAIEFYKLMGYEVIKSYNDFKSNNFISYLRKKGCGELELISPQNESSGEYSILKENGSQFLKLFFEISDLNKFKKQLKNDYLHYNISGDINYGILKKYKSVYEFNKYSYIQFYEKIIEDKQKKYKEWKIDIENYKSIKHKNYLLPLIYNTEMQLMKIPLYQNIHLNVNIEYVAPQTKFEKEIAEIWSNIIGVKRIGLNDNFFSVGGDSIKALRIVAKMIERKLKAEVNDLFLNPTVGKFCEVIEDKNQNNSINTQGKENKSTDDFLNNIIRDEDKPFIENMKKEDRNIQEAYILSPMQEYVLSHNLYSIENTSEYFCYEITFDIDIALFKQSWKNIIKANDLLRSTFIFRKVSVPYQIVYSDLDIDWVEEDWTKYDLETQIDLLNKYLSGKAKTKFNIKNPPLYKFFLAKLSNSKYFFVWTLYNSFIDGWSINIVFNELLNSYKNLSQSTDCQVNVQMQFKDYIKWYVNQDNFKAKIYWSNMYKDLVQTKKNINLMKEISIEKVSIDLNSEITEKLNIFSRQNKLTLNSIILAGWIDALKEIEKENDCIVGVISSGRPGLSGITEMLGQFVNILPLRVKERENSQTLLDWINKINTMQLEMKKYEYIPINLIAECSKVNIKILQDNIYTNTFGFQNFPGIDGSLEDNTLFKFHSSNVNINMLRRLYVFPGKNIVFNLSFDSNTYKKEVINLLLESIKDFINKLIK